ncbi:hypothetical protein K445DRAFT_15836 [Daldinia sp. EC12]|nr:hypothetical protein K445DRAFT_15836 [Daldinia sp. EC12]
MASLLLFRDGASPPLVPYTRSLAGTVISVILSFAAFCVLSCFLTQRSLAVKAWSRLSLATFLVFAIYLDSWAFVFGSGIVDYGLGVDSNLGVCSSAILLCLFFYVTSKIVEKAFLIQGGIKRRVESKLYISNLFGVLTIFAIICILTFVYRTSRMNNKGQCIIGIERQALIPLITLEIVANVYITAFFLNPLWNIYSIQKFSNAPASPPELQRATIRTFVGALCTTTSSVVASRIFAKRITIQRNLVVLMVLNGEPGWVFLACCNADSNQSTNWFTVLFSTLIIQWVTACGGDSSTTASSSPPSSPPDNQAEYRPPPRALSPLHRGSQRLNISLPLKTTSTSQYEHIFGDVEPETETDVVSASSVSKHRAGSSRFDEDNDGFHTPIMYDGPDGDISDSVKNERVASSIWTSPPPPPPLSARADARAGDQALGKSPTPAPGQVQSQSPPREGPSIVSAAVAADLERIRRYRGRRTNWPSTTVRTSTPPPPPTSTSVTSTSHSLASVPPPGPTPRSPPTARGSVREYYISQLAFEEGDAGSRWHELIQAEAGRDEEEGRGENGAVAGWI